MKVFQFCDNIFRINGDTVNGSCRIHGNSKETLNGEKRVKANCQNIVIFVGNLTFLYLGKRKKYTEFLQAGSPLSGDLQSIGWNFVHR